jgi:hypothetical protein
LIAAQNSLEVVENKANKVVDKKRSKVYS